MSFKISLDIFRGPVDLLLYLVRKHEVEIADVSVAAVAQQFLDSVEMPHDLDLNGVGDFLEIASILTELKSRMVLPRAGEEIENQVDEIRQDLVRQLLEFKKFRDAASMLEECGREWQEHYARLTPDGPSRLVKADEQPEYDLQLWDLVGAFNRLLAENETPAGANIVYDDTPIHVYMTQIAGRLAAQVRVGFAELFPKPSHKSQVVSIFLALLELIRHQKVRVEQDDLFGEIWVVATEEVGRPIDPDEVANYDHVSQAVLQAGTPATEQED